MKLNRKIYGFTTALIIAIMMISSVFSSGEAKVNLPVRLEGTLNGAEYLIRVPENWGGTLLVFAHGYGQPSSAQAAPGGTAMEDFLLSQGYALAGSRYQADGWAIKEGIIDTLSLTNFFGAKVGTPDQVILWGFSMGSVIAFESAERYSDIYDGVISACALGAGTVRTWDSAFTLALAYDVAFGWPEDWGTSDNVRNDLVFNSDVFPVLFNQVIASSNFGFFEFMRMVSGIPFDGFYSGANFLFTDMFFLTEARGELESRAGGPIVENIGHTYTLTESDLAYLAALGVDAGSLLQAMNARTNIVAPKNARNYVKHYAEYTGDIKTPVLTIHTVGDGLVVVNQENAYRSTVEAAGMESLLVQVYTDAVGHCDFNPLQLLFSISAMEFWLASGIAPSSAFFPEAFGFLNDFEPSPMPF
ncbi:MAG: hypothetical protein IH840_01300 [Candidatus Heimdallarchaeota archaeon]|nr:hypothetical protein [Candidatus Heimdallarchaeota archaeon]